MIMLQPVTKENFYPCLELEREEWFFVGDAYAVLANAYLYRESSMAYAIYLDEVIIGMVILDEKEHKVSMSLRICLSPMIIKEKDMLQKPWRQF